MKVDITQMSLNDVSLIEPNFSNLFDEFWSIQILRDDLTSPNSKYIVARMSDEIVGFAGIKCIVDNSDIMNIVVRKDKRKLGIGSILIEELIKIAQNQNCSSLTLEVNKKNVPAIALYKKYHFKRIGLRKKYYNNTDNAIIMKKDI